MVERSDTHRDDKIMGFASLNPSYEAFKNTNSVSS
jgi:hypothetical protein